MHLLVSEQYINVVLLHRIHLWNVCLADITYFAVKNYTRKANKKKFVMPRHVGTRLCHFYLWLTVQIIVLYTGRNRRNGPDFGRVFLRSNYTDMTQNTYIQNSMVTEILAREVSNVDSYYSLIDYQIHIETGRNMWFL